MKKRPQPRSISNRERLNVFLLLLIRDVVPCRTVAEILETIDALTPKDRGRHHFKNRHLDAYVRDLSARLWKE